MRNKRVVLVGLNLDIDMYMFVSLCWSVAYLKPHDSSYAQDKILQQGFEFIDQKL